MRVAGTSSADKTVNRILDGIDLLGTSPYLGSLHHDPVLARLGYRKQVLGITWRYIAWRMGKSSCCGYFAGRATTQGGSTSSAGAPGVKIKSLAEKHGEAVPSGDWLHAQGGPAGARLDHRRQCLQLNYSTAAFDLGTRVASCRRRKRRRLFVPIRRSPVKLATPSKRSPKKARFLR